MVAEITDKIDKLEKTSEYLKVMAHPLRLKIVSILLRNPFSVGELAGACQLSSQIISTHLRKLNDRGVLKKERHGTKVYYQVVKPVCRNIVDCFVA